MAKQWTDKEDNCLKALVDAGTSHREIASIMHRTRSAVSQRSFNLGLTKKRKSADLPYMWHGEHVEWVAPNMKPKPAWWSAMMWWRK